MRQTHITIDRKALHSNFNRVRQLAPNAKIVSMVKANAYGHGIAACLPALKDTDSFGVACLDEALEIRKLGYQQPITLIEGVFDPTELDTAIEYSCECMIHQQQQLEWLLSAKKEYQEKKLKVWVKLNAGMNRLGFQATEIVPIIHQLKSEGFTCILTMHFANADIENHPLNQIQKEIFLSVKDACHPVLASCCNSAAILKWKDLHFDYVRPGIMLYGASPFAGVYVPELNLKPVMTFKANIISINHVKKNECIGYGSTFIAPQDMKVGIVGVGYGDGYPRAYLTQNYVYLSQQLSPLIGRVSMDMMAIDLSNTHSKIGDSVELWGKNRLIDHVAEANGTIGYELLCRLTPRPHRFVNNES